MYNRWSIWIFCCLCVAPCSDILAQSAEGYWISSDKSGYFQGVDDMEMRVDRTGQGLRGNIYYIWEHGFYYQDISLEGTLAGGDSVILVERDLVDNRNGDIQDNCFGSFRLVYSRDQNKEYLTGIWVRPPGQRFACPDSRVSFFRVLNHAGSQLPPDIAARTPHRVNRRKGEPASPPPAATSTSVAIAPVAARMAIDEDSSRLLAFHTRKDSVEQIIPHHSDSVRLELYDDGIVDGDRISIFLGDSLILKNYELLAHAKVVLVRLDPSHTNNVLSLYAENEGSIPPNTALMVIYVDDQRYDVRLSSDMETNARVVFQKIASTAE